MNGKYFLFTCVVSLLLPSLLLSFYKRFDSQQQASDLSLPEKNDPNDVIWITVLMDNEEKKIELEEYITGVVLAEMPASFDIEALKAQAVVARTFTLKRRLSDSKHNKADVCTDYTCCQAYQSYEGYLQLGGTEDSVQKVQEAVLATTGQVLLYQNALIDATYFSCSGGRTEDAVAVWGSDVPYLQATDSPGEEHASHYTDTVTISAKELCNRLGISPSTQAKDLVGRITYTDGGGVDSIELGGNIYKGTSVRQKLELRSTAFTISIIGDEIVITTKGYGHRVGMSQYGADAMAKSGYDYRNILYHYYQGTKLSDYKP